MKQYMRMHGVIASKVDEAADAVTEVVRDSIRGEDTELEDGQPTPAQHKHERRGGVSTKGRKPTVWGGGSHTPRGKSNR